MRLSAIVLGFIAFLLTPITSAQARHHHRHHHAKDRVTQHHHGGLVTVRTAAGTAITVSQSFAPKITAFIADLVSHGYHPKRISCFAAHGHVRNSRHHSGNACDFSQRGWGKTDRAMYHVGALAAKYGLRDGCSFGDCGHIDDGHQVHAYRHTRHYARRYYRHYGG